MNVKSTDGVSIEYRVAGSGKPALVFVHGWCCDQSYWGAQLPHFAAYHTVVTIDLAGHGASGLNRNNWTIQAFGEDVVAVVDQLGLEKVVLIGHSLGGSVIVEAARSMPDRILALVGADTFTNVEIIPTPEQVEHMLAGFRTNFVDTMNNVVRGTMFVPESDPALIDRIVSDMSAGSVEVVLGIPEDSASYDLALSLEDVKAPIYCINSETSQLNVEAVKRHSSLFTPKFMAGVGHFVMIEDPETFNRMLDEIIAEIASQKPEGS